MQTETIIKNKMQFFTSLRRPILLKVPAEKDCETLNLVVCTSLEKM